MYDSIKDARTALSLYNKYAALKAGEQVYVCMCSFSRESYKLKTPRLIVDGGLS